MPEDRLAYQTKLEIALAALDRLQAAGVTWGCVLADAGYGIGAAFRQALSARGLTWAVGIPRIQKVYPASVRWRRRLTWRTGTKGPLSARFAAVRVVAADGPQNAVGQHLPGEAA